MKKKVLGLIYIAVTLAITIGICLLTTDDFTPLFEVIQNINWWWMLGALGCMLVYFVFEAMPQYIIYKNHGYHLPLLQSVKVGVIGLYYSGITPSATGGQPMQVYYLSKLKLPVGVSSFISVLKLIFFQGTMTAFCMAGYFIKFDYIHEHYQTAVYFMYLGVAINMVLVAGIIALLIKPAVLIRFVRGLMRFLAKFIGRKAVKWRRKTLIELAGFYRSYKESKRDFKDTFAVLWCSIIQVVAYLSVSFFIYHAFGLSGENFITLFAIQGLVVCAVSFFPLPGSAGAQELGYGSFFSPIFGEGIFPAMILWRILSSYLAIISGAVIVTVDAAKTMGKKK